MQPLCHVSLQELVRLWRPDPANISSCRQRAQPQEPVKSSISGMLSWGMRSSRFKVIIRHCIPASKQSNQPMT